MGGYFVGTFDNSGDRSIIFSVVGLERRVKEENLESLESTESWDPPALLSAA
jgi:hypothetical protein